MAGTAACSDVGDNSGGNSSAPDGSTSDGTTIDTSPSGDDSSPSGDDSSPAGDDTASPGDDTGNPGDDTGNPDGDSAAPEASGDDTGTSDTGTSGDGPGDDATTDAGAGDSTVESGMPETGPDDATTDATADVTAPETGPADTGTPDTGTPDTGTQDTGTQDTGTQDAGTQDTGTQDTGTAAEAGNDSGPTTLSAHCKPNNGGAPCTPTELLLIEHDTNPDGTGKAGNVPFGCYDCMVTAGCMDDKLFASDVDHECGDTGSGGITQPTLSGGDATASCLDVVSCILSKKCTDITANAGPCYCGTATASQCAMPGAPNGPCLMQEQDGTDSTDPATVNMRFTNTAYAGGMANTLFACAVTNSCTQCTQ